MRKILISAATLCLLSFTQANDSIKLEQQKKCKADSECKPKFCIRGICANKTIFEALSSVEAVSQEEDKITLMDSVFKLEQ